MRACVEPNAGTVGRMRVCFVCLGNICRSPTAEAVLRQLVDAAGVAIDVDSAGTSGWHAGELPDPRTRAAAARRGMTMTHRARQLTRADGDAAHAVVLWIWNAEIARPGGEPLRRGARSVRARVRRLPGGAAAALARTAKDVSARESGTRLKLVADFGALMPVEHRGLGDVARRR